MNYTQRLYENRNLLIGISIVLLLFYGYYSYSKNKFNVFDRMTTNGTANSHVDVITNPSSSSSTSNSSSSTLDPHELLPIDDHNKWTALNPVSQTSLVVPDVLQSDFFIGINTVGTSKKNPNLQGIGREDPIISKIDTSGQWNLSSLDTR